MDGRMSPPFYSARRHLRRGGGFCAVTTISLLLIAISGQASADDPSSLRPLARRYSSPARLFVDGETNVEVDRLAVPQKMFVLPPVAPPSIEFSVEEPPAFVVQGVPAPSSTVAAGAPLATSSRPAPTAAARPAPALPAEPVATPARKAPFQRPSAPAPARPAPLLLGGTTPETRPAGSMLATREISVSRAVSPSLVVPEPPAPAHIVSMIPDAPNFDPSPEPLNITIGAMSLADQPPPAPGVDSSSTAAQSGEPGSFGKVEKLGDAPPSDTLDFLRSQAVLLKPGQYQVDWGLTYTVLDAHFALPVVNGSGTVVSVANGRARLQLMTIPLAVRYGICDGLQGYLNVPLGWSNTEATDNFGDSATNNFVGVADISGGLSYHIMKGCGSYVPDVIASLGFVAPSGHATFATSLLAPNSALGQGFWDITTSVLAVHTIDPIVFYYGAGYVHRFENSIDGINVNPGEEFDYLFGVGFAVNPWITISGTFIGNYLTRFGVDGVSIPGSDLDLMRFRVSVTVVKDKHICEPFGEIAMTPDTPSRVGIVFTY